MKIETKTFSPAELAKILAASKNWRKLRDMHVDALLSDMRAGLWNEDVPEFIKFAKGGGLADGQHRLTAEMRWQKEGGKPHRFQIVRDVDESVVMVIDSGLKRRPCDYLAALGAKNVNAAASLCGILIRQAWEAEESDAPHFLSGRVFIPGKETIPVSQIVECYKENSKLVDLWAAKCAAAKPPYANGCFAGVCMLIHKWHDASEASDFFTAISQEGHSDGPIDPIAALRRRIEADRRLGGTHSKMVWAALTIKTWNNWHAGKPTQLLRFIAFGPKANEFPQLSFAEVVA